VDLVDLVEPSDFFCCPWICQRCRGFREVNNALFLLASTCQWLFGICYREEKIYPDGGRPRCGKPCAEDSLRKVIRQERPEILC
jgi:hypothetical protein